MTYIPGIRIREDEEMAGKGSENDHRGERSSRDGRTQRSRWKKEARSRI